MNFTQEQINLNNYEKVKEFVPTWRVYAPAIAYVLVISVLGAVAIGMGSIIMGCVCLVFGILCLCYLGYLYSRYRYKAYIIGHRNVEYIVFYDDKTNQEKGIYRFLGPMDGFDKMERFQVVNGELKSVSKW
jgi:hypothetical protein